MPVRFKQDSNYVPGLNRARFPITGTGAIRNVGSSLPGARMPILADNYLVYYFDELSGTTVTNYGAATGNNLTLTGGGATRNNTSIYSRGTPGTTIARTSPITYAANTSVSGLPGSGEGWTVEVTCSFSGTHSGSDEPIVSLRNEPLYNSAMVIRRTSLTQIQLLVFNGGQGNATLTATIPSSSNLCHITATFKNQQTQIYINGQLANTGSTPFFLQPFSPYLFNRIWVGTDVTDATCPYGFAVGEVRLSAGTLRDATYVQQAYNNALTL